MTTRHLPVRAVRTTALITALCAGLGAGVLSLPASAAGPHAASTPVPVTGEAGSNITAAERMLFTTDHLHGARPQTELDYRFGRTGALPGLPNDTDTVRVQVVSPDNANSDAQVTDKTGKVSVANGGLPCNPVVIYFLERDIGEMEKLSGGQKRYFQKRVRMALANNPEVKPVTVQVNGKATPAHQIVIQPYLDDPNAERFAKLIGKRYTFVFADKVPGQVVTLKTEVPGMGNDFAHPVQTETLSFDAVYLKPPASTKTPAAGHADAAKKI